MSKKLYTNNQVVAILLSFERFITGSYTLIGTLPSGKQATLLVEAGSLVKAYQEALRGNAPQLQTPPPHTIQPDGA